MNFEVENCELNDSNIRAVIELSKEWESEDLTFGYCANDIDDIKGNDLFFAYCNDRIVGYLYGKISVFEESITPIEKGSRYFEIEEIYVKKEYRSQGIGKALFDYIENYYKQTVDYITLSTATKNFKSILHFYIEKVNMNFWSAKLFKKI